MNPLSKNNEELSAIFALMLVKDKGMAETIKECILGTAINSCPEKLIVQYTKDLDLMILASNPESFRAYDKLIREEYTFLPPEIFRIGRTEFISAMLKKPVIFSSPFFHALCEEKARKNLTALLIELT
jgi:predicted metal-dependent HD superfamily phosphohydrolase